MGDNLVIFLKLVVLHFVFWNSLLFLSLTNSTIVIAMALMISILNDSFAYLFGRKYGRIFCIKSSKNKSLEGYMFGIFFSTILLFIFCFFIEKITFAGLNIEGKNKLILLPVFHFLSFISHIGDSYFSSIKRKLNIKDFGNLIGEQGGFWDRFDSHTFVLFSLFLMQSFICLFI